MDELLEEQAAELEAELPVIMRRLFTLDPDHPVSDLPVGQVRVCSLLQGGPRAMSSLAEELGISMSAITQIADRLERAGLVERINDSGDRRVRNLQLTREGDALMRSRRAARIQRAAAALDQLSPEARLVVIRAVRELRSATRSIAFAPPDLLPAPVERVEW